MGARAMMGRRHRHFAWRGMRSGRFFDHGDLRFLLLKLISDKPRHGYELIKAIEEQFGGAYSPSPGVIYPTLAMLEDMGYASVAPAEGNRKLYSITQEGRQFLEANKVQVDAVFARLEEAGRIFGGGLAPELARAIKNLRAVLMSRLRQGNLGDDQAKAIAAALDRAARDIEQS